MKIGGIRIWQLLVIALALLLFASLYMYQEFRFSGGYGFPLDDAWIHCQYARNIARGNGMSFNPGIPSSGSTAPLWTIVLAASYFITQNIVFSAKAIGLALHLLSCVMAFKIILFILEDERYAFLGAVLMAMVSWFTWGALSGMEVMFSVFLTLAGIYLHLLYRRKKSVLHYASTVVFALASLVRPESMLLVFFALLDDLLLGRIEKNEPAAGFLKRAFIHLLLFFVLLSPYFIFNYHMTGEPVPNTFAAKRGGGLIVFLLDPNREELRKIFLLYPRLYLGRMFDLCKKLNILLYWFMFAGMGTLLYEGMQKKRQNKALIFPLIFLLYPLITSIVSPSRDVLGWMFRYMANMIALDVILGVVGLRVIVSFFGLLIARFWTHGEGARKITRLFSGIILSAIFLSLSLEQYENSGFYARGVENINSMQVRIGRWIGENTPPGAVAATCDIGAIAYFSGRDIIDLVGLVTPEMLSYRKQRDGVFQYLAQQRPDYIVIFPSKYPDFARHKELTHVFDVRLKINAVCGDSIMAVYKAEWNSTQRK